MKPACLSLLTVVATLLASCATRPHSPPAQATAVPVRLKTTAEIQAMPPVEVRYVERVSEYSVRFHTQDGREFILGEDTGAQEVWHFLYTLRPGQECRLPDTFNNYLNAPHYGSIAEITAMPPRIGTLASRSPCSAMFTTPGGKYFGIGDPGSERQVSQFISSLTNNECCRLPDAFLAWQKHHPAKAGED